MSSNPVSLLNRARRGIENLVSDNRSEGEFIIFAQRRSGHHAVINWIRANLGTSSLFLNNCLQGKNPLTSCFNANEFDPRVSSESPINKQRFLREGPPTGIILYNFENPNLWRAFLGRARLRRRFWMGGSQRSFEILVFRDPFNLLASNLRWSRGSQGPSHHDLLAMREGWKRYARAFLKGGSRRFVFVSYNHWFVDPEFRARLAARLALSGHTAGLDVVANYGPTTWGDSFDGFTFDGRAHEMKVLERWKNYVDDEEYRDLLNDGVLSNLARKIYGGMPEIEEALAVLSD